MSASTSTSPNSTEIAEAQRVVAERKAELAQSLRLAGRSSQQFAEHIGSEMKPALLAATAVIGAAALVGVGAVLLKRNRRQRGWLAPERTSPWAVVARSAGLWLARVAARRLAEEVAHRLAAPAPSPGGSIASSPDQI